MVRLANVWKPEYLFRPAGWGWECLKRRSGS